MLIGEDDRCICVCVVVVVVNLPLSGDQQHGRDVYQCHVVFASS